MSLKDECEKAIASHAAWKVKFKRFVAGELTLDASVVERNDACDFGKWLAAEGRRVLPSSSFQELEAAHVAFHRTAGEIVRCKHAGEHGKVDAALAPGGSFTQAGAQLTMLVVRVRDA